jgi:uncharacterized protein
MKLEGDHVFNGPRQAVWEMIRDPEVLSTALPGESKLTKLSETEYDGVMSVRIGPVSGVFSGKLVVSNEVPPESCTLTVDGKGAPGFVRGVGHVNFVEQDDNTTYMTYTGELTVGGTLASVGQRMLDSVGKSIIRQGFEVLDKALEARLANKDGEQVVFKAPTEVEFAASVAKDMTQNLMENPQVKMLMKLIPVAILVGVLILVVNALTKKSCCSD